MSEARMRDIPDAEMTPEQHKVAEILRASPRKGLPGPFHALLRNPELCDRVRHLGDFIRYENTLSPALRELAVLIVARFFSAHYEWQAHKKHGIAAGLDDLPLFAATLAPEAENVTDPLREQLEAIDADSLSPREALDLVYALKQLSASAPI